MPFIICNFSYSEIQTQYIKFVSVHMWDSCSSAFLRHLICLASLLCAPPTTDCQLLSVTGRNMWARTAWVALNAVWGGEVCSQMHIATSNICKPMTSWKKLSLRRITFGTEVRGVDLSHFKWAIGRAAGVKSVRTAGRYIIRRGRKWEITKNPIFGENLLLSKFAFW